MRRGGKRGGEAVRGRGGAEGKAVLLSSGPTHVRSGCMRVRRRGRRERGGANGRGLEREGGTKEGDRKSISSWMGYGV